MALGHVSLDGETQLYASYGTNATETVGALLARLDAVTYLRDAGLTDGEIRALRARLLPA